jgi:putative hydrolase of the HAD superfamily
VTPREPHRAVIFDVGGVLIRTRSRHRRDAWEQRLRLQPGEASKIVFDGERGNDLQCGLVTAEAHWQWVARRLSLGPDELEAFRKDFFAEDFLDTELLAYVDRLRAAGYHLGLLSNAADNARPLFRDDYPILDHFDSVTLSCEEGVMKPDPRIYRVALARAGARPAEAVFVDDMPANVDAARQVGMLAVQFQGTDQAIAELARLTGIG